MAKKKTTKKKQVVKKPAVRATSSVGSAVPRVGTKAPDFRAVAHDGSPVRLSDFKGRPVVLYFYPKDDTPGCTKEACSFRDLKAEFTALGVVVLGVSPDGADDHEAFRKKFSLPFTLLSDEDRNVMTAYDAYGEKMMYGKKTIGIIRSTVVITYLAARWQWLPPTWSDLP